MRETLLVITALAATACTSTTTGAVCHFHSDCASPLVCQDGVCSEQCHADRDCTDGRVCSTSGGVGVCEAPSACDGGCSDASVPDAGSTLDAGTPPDAAGDTDAGVARCVDATCIGQLVISEVAGAGPRGTLDEFVELYNRSGSKLDISGIVVESRVAGTWVRLTSAPAGAVMAPNGFYTFASGVYAGPGPDMAFGSGVGDMNGAIHILAGSVELDLVGWGTIATFEGTALPTLSSTEMSAGASYERLAHAGATATSMSTGGADERAGNGYDTDDNGNDLVIRALRQPQTAASPVEP